MGWIALASAIAGIISTLLAYFLNPQRRKDSLRRQLVDTYQQLEVWERKRDEALQANNSDALTLVTQKIIDLRKQKQILLDQLKG
jgi:hypothetical protein